MFSFNFQLIWVLFSSTSKFSKINTNFSKSKREIRKKNEEKEMERLRAINRDAWEWGLSFNLFYPNVVSDVITLRRL